MVSGTGALPRLESRVLALEEARLDLRVGALEMAAQHSAPFTAPPPSALLDGLNDADHLMSAGIHEDASDFDTRGIDLRASGDELDVSQRVCSYAVPGLDTAEARIEARLVAPLGHYVSDDTEHIDYALMMSQLAEAEAVASGGDGRQPLISDDLKERLETLVQQVKATLQATPREALQEDSYSLPAALHHQSSAQAFSDLPGQSYTPYAPVVSAAPALQTTYGAPPFTLQVKSSVQRPSVTEAVRQIPDSLSRTQQTDSLSMSQSRWQMHSMGPPPGTPM